MLPRVPDVGRVGKVISSALTGEANHNETITTNKETMLHWSLLKEQEPFAAEPPPRGTMAGEAPPEEEGAGVDVP